MPQHVVANPRLGTWIAAVGGWIDVRVGKVELGQGILTTLRQVAADSLAVAPDLVRMVPASTACGPDQGLTAGSLSVLQTAPALRHVGAVVRALAGPTDPDSGYLERIAALDPETDLTAPAERVAAESVSCHHPVRPSTGRSAPRIDLPGKVLGRPSYLTDRRPDHLLHGRVLRPPSPAARLADLDPDWTWAGAQLVRDGSFVGLVGEREADVDRAQESLAAACVWAEPDTLPDEDDLAAWLRSGEHEEITVLDEGEHADGTVLDEGEQGRITLSASYSRPFLAHASIGTSAALARWDEAGRRVRVWSHSQGIHALRVAIARTLAIDLSTEPDRVEVEHAEHAGCYGHNGADDAAFDAVLLARAVPGRPVLVRWSRSDELAWSPLASAMTATIRAGLAGGRISGWAYDVWSLGHSARPGYRGVPGLLAGAHLAEPVTLPPASDPPLPAGGGTTRNAVPLYRVGPRRITGRRRRDSPLRTSAMRSLGAHLNVFAIESFMDELAAAAGTDPVDFRLAHLDDERAAQVIRLAAEAAGWGGSLSGDVGRGIGFARYKGTGAYCAVVAEVEAIHEIRVRRLTVAADIGTVINPDGAANQLEGGAVQSTSWTVRERVRFDRCRITSSDWESYPILRFSETPLVAVRLVDSAAPSVGAGEAAQGPTAAAIANAVQSAIGVRIRDLPLTADAVVDAIRAAPG